jgi:hypothetical protein
LDEDERRSPGLKKKVLIPGSFQNGMGKNFMFPGIFLASVYKIRRKR